MWAADALECRYGRCISLVARAITGLAFWYSGGASRRTLMQPICRVVSAILIGLSSTQALSVSKCIGADGRVSYQDAACPENTNDKRSGNGARLPPVSRGQIQAAERKEIVDRMNADLSSNLAEKARREEIERKRIEASEPKPKSTSQPIEFSQCRRVVANSLLSVAGRAKTYVVVDTAVMTVHKICTNDGSVLLTCDAADGRMVTTASPYACN